MHCYLQAGRGSDQVGLWRRRFSPERKGDLMQRSVLWLVALFALAIGSSLTLAEDKDKTSAEAKKPAEEKSEAELIKERFGESSGA